MRSAADGFRGASPAALADEVRAHFPDHTPLLLANNYRSTPAIVAASRAIIAPNYVAGREAKKLVAVRTAGLPVQLVQCATIADEYARIAAEVDAWRAVGVALGKGSTAGVGDGMAVLFLRYEDVAGFVAHMRERWGDHADDRLTDCRSKTDNDEEDGEAKGKMLVSTIHSIKGLEYEIVFLAGLGEMTTAEDVDDFFSKPKKPKSWVSHAQWVMSTSAEGPVTACEEIRRLLYVAASRPRSLLHVSYAGGAAGWCEAVHYLRNLSRLPQQKELLLPLRCGASPGGGSGDAAEEPPWRTAAELAAAFSQRSAKELMYAGPPREEADDASPKLH